MNPASCELVAANSQVRFSLTSFLHLIFVLFFFFLCKKELMKTCDFNHLLHTASIIYKADIPI